jgi:hypothetical protein
LILKSNGKKRATIKFMRSRDGRRVKVKTYNAEHVSQKLPISSEEILNLVLAASHLNRGGRSHLLDQSLEVSSELVVTFTTP